MRLTKKSIWLISQSLFFIYGHTGKMAGGCHTRFYNTLVYKQLLKLIWQTTALKNGSDIFKLQIFWISITYKKMAVRHFTYRRDWMMVISAACTSREFPLVITASAFLLMPLSFGCTSNETFWRYCLTGLPLSESYYSSSDRGGYDGSSFIDIHSGTSYDLRFLETRTPETPSEMICNV